MKLVKDILGILLFLSMTSCVTSQVRIPPLGSLEDGPPRDPGVPLGSMCDADSRIPDKLPVCGSCKDRCGSKSNPSASFSDCACDVACGYHGDCCYDFHQFCPDEYQDFRRKLDLYPFTRTFTDFTCKPMKTGASIRASTLMITTCPDGSACGFVERLGADVNVFVPMYDTDRGVHFVNGRCAVCNGAQNILPWGVKLECNPVPEEARKDYMESGVVNSTENLEDITGLGACSFVYVPQGESRSCSSSLVSTCPEGCQNQSLVALCEEEFHSWTILVKTYKNQYCALCNAGNGSSTGDLVCSKDLITPNGNANTNGNKPSIWPGQLGPNGQKPKPFGSFSLTLVFDFDPRKGLTVGEHSPPPECSTGEVYVPEEDLCRPITCPSGFVLDQSDCVPAPSNITAILSGVLNLNGRQFSSQPAMAAPDNSRELLETNLKNKMADLFAEYNVTYHDVTVTLGFLRNDSSVETDVTITCSCDFSSLEKNEARVEEFETSVRSEIRQEVIKYFLDRGESLSSVMMELGLELTNVSASERMRQNSGCTWVLYRLNETEAVNETLKVIPTGRVYQKGEFQVLGDDVIVCGSGFGIPVEPPLDDVTFALEIVTLVCVGISIICLVTRIVLHCFISALQNRPGKLQLHLTVAFLVAFIMLIAGPLASHISELCITIAVLTGYGFLAAFTWMNIIAVDTWLVFRPSAAFSRSDEESRSLLVHYLCGWGIPCVLVAIATGMNYSDVDPRFRPQFGGSRCWYTDRYAMLYYFGVPIGVSIIVNTVLYILTSINLHKAFGNANNVMKAENHHFGIYVRLFVLMGITWVFGFISAFTTELVIDFLFVILTSLQGLFLFVSFVINKRVLSEIRKKTKSETSSFEKKTKSTPLPSFDSTMKSDTKV